MPDAATTANTTFCFLLVGPTLTRMALTAAGEIRPEGRTSARVENKPKEPVSVQG